MAYGTAQVFQHLEWICAVSVSSSWGLITINMLLETFWDLESLTFWHYVELNGGTVEGLIVRRQQ